MDDAALRTLATRLRAELDTVSPDPTERARIRTELDTALGADPLDRDALLDVVNRRASTRSWYAAAVPVTNDVDRGFERMAGAAKVTLLYYVCPQGDQDVVLDSRPRQPPRCPNHDIEMLTAD